VTTTDDLPTTDEALHHLSVELRLLMSVIWKVSHQAADRSLASAGIDITRLQLGVLRLLSSEGAHTLSDISRKFGLDPSTLVPTIDALERKGYVERRRDPQDRRRVPVTITDNGTALVNSVPVVIDDDPLVEGLRRLGPQAAQELNQLLCQLVHIMPDTGEALEGALARLQADGIQRGHFSCKEPAD